MKKLLKTAVSLLLALTLMVASVPVNGFVIDADAAAKLKTTVSYTEDGTAVLSIAASVWENEIRYTTDGSVPNKNSKLYVTELEFTEKTLVRIAEFDTKGRRISAIKKTVTPKAGEVNIETYQDGDVTIIVMSCDTEGADIYYTTDKSVPDENSILYEHPFVVRKETRIRAKAFKDGCSSASAVSVTAEIMDENEDEAVAASSKPDEKDDEEEKDNRNNTEDEKKDEEVKQVVDNDDVISNDKVNYKLTYMAEKGKTYVTLNKSKNSNYFRYTIDGTTPTNQNGKKYKERVPFTEPTTIRVREYNSKGQVVGSMKLNVKIKCASVEFYSTKIGVGTITVGMETATEGATIYYTTDGSMPDPEYAEIYSEPVTVGSNADIMALAVKDGYKDGSVTQTVAGRAVMRLEDFNFADPIYDQTADLINQYRYINGKYNLILDEDLTRAANIRARELPVKFSSKRPNGLNYASIFEEQGITTKFSTEFVSIYHKTPEEIVNSIISDPNNQKALLGLGYDYNRIGIGFYKKGNSYYWSIIIAEM